MPRGRGRAFDYEDPPERPADRAVRRAYLRRIIQGDTNPQGPGYKDESIALDLGGLAEGVDDLAGQAQGVVLGAARAGIGVTVALSYHVAEAIRSGELVPFLQEFQPPPQPVSFVYAPNRFMPAKLRAFLDFAVPRLRARLADLPKGIAPRKRMRSHGSRT